MKQRKKRRWSIKTWDLAGETFAAARVSCGLEQGQLARRLGVNVNTVGRWERGESTISEKHLVAAAKILGVDPEALKIPRADGENKPSPEALEVLHALGKLPQEHVDYIHALTMLLLLGRNRASATTSAADHADVLAGTRTAEGSAGMPGEGGPPSRQ